MEHSPVDSIERARRLGRNLGLGFYSLLVAAFTVICSVQICMQVWAPQVHPLNVGCSAGTLRLVEAIEAARLATLDEVGEQAALTKFRAVVGPAWASRPGLGRACASDDSALRHLREVDRLRYAEEHAVRYAAVDLAKRRQEVKRLIPSLRETVESSQR